MTRAILITGAAQGLGWAMALHLAQPGTLLLLHYRSSLPQAQALAQQAQQNGAQAHLLQADLARLEQREALMDQVAALTPRLDVLINNVGLYNPLPLNELTPEQWSRTLEGTLGAAFHLTQRAAPLLAPSGQGRVINLGDALALAPAARPRAADYFTAKLGVWQLTKTFAQALAAQGTTVNLIAPGVLENSNDGLEVPIPAGRLGTFDDVLAALDFLLSPAAQYTTGTALSVAGGLGL
ncbi:MAG: SDR family oxidoreductase [Deltaproteobacteria bacterium]|nr:SDR family oxidoreductase [Deltaproteobacteria bacterium]